MKTLRSDTHPAIEQMIIERMRVTPAWRKVEMVAEMNETVRLMMIAGIKNRYPHASPELVRRHLADLLLGPEAALKVYGPFPEA